MLMGRDQLCALIPHGDGMCLLDEVVSWNEQSITCRTSTHLDPANPLRGTAGLSSLQSIEYGAQAMAVHGGLLIQETERCLQSAYLAALREVTFNTEWLHIWTSVLTVEATRLIATGRSLMYEFCISADGSLLVKGRATVIGNVGGMKP